jgi:peroxiredoxin Q/BCP
MKIQHAVTLNLFLWQRDAERSFCERKNLQSSRMPIGSQGMIQVGEQAPDFELSVHTGDRIRLSDFRGRSNVVLFFYPADFTIGCTSEACSFRDHFSQLQRSNALLVGISPDDLETHRRFAQAYGFQFLLASDPDLTVCKRYGAVWFGGRLVKRITVVIDRQGMVRGVVHHELLWRRHSTAVVQLLSSLD